MPFIVEPLILDMLRDHTNGCANVIEDTLRPDSNLPPAYIFFGHRSLIKNKIKTAEIYILK